MKVGIPREIKNNEYRVAITPSGVHELARHGHDVFVEHDAGVGSSINDDDYVAAGARSFTVNDASEFKVGDAVLVGRPVTAAWVHFMGMDTLVRDGAPQSWRAVGSADNYEREITAISGNQVTVDIPLRRASLPGGPRKPPRHRPGPFCRAGR